MAEAGPISRHSPRQETNAENEAKTLGHLPLRPRPSSDDMIPDLVESDRTISLPLMVRPSFQVREHRRCPSLSQTQCPSLSLISCLIRPVAMASPPKVQLPAASWARRSCQSQTLIIRQGCSMAGLVSQCRCKSARCSLASTHPGNPSKRRTPHRHGIRNCRVRLLCSASTNLEAHRNCAVYMTI